MTPKEKANELVEKMAIYHWTDICDYEGAKQCALIAVDEILEIINNTMVLVDIEDDYDFYLKVKQEIEKL